MVFSEHVILWRFLAPACFAWAIFWGLESWSEAFQELKLEDFSWPYQGAYQGRIRAVSGPYQGPSYQGRMKAVSEPYQGRIRAVSEPYQGRIRAVSAYPRAATGPILVRQRGSQWFSGLSDPKSLITAPNSAQNQRNLSGYKCTYNLAKTKMRQRNWHLTTVLGVRRARRDEKVASAI